MPIEGIAFAIGSFILGKAAEKTVTAGLEGGAKGLASGIAGWREKRRFDKVLDQTWTDFRKDSAVEFRVARALETILWDESESAQQFRAEAVKLLAPGTEPTIVALARLYNERLKWARFWGKEAAPPWEDLATPLTRFFELLRDHLLQDKLLGPPMVERSEQDWLQTSAEALEELRRFWEQAVTPSGALRVQAEPREFADEEWAAAEQRYRELALASCDIIDLANLPEDRHLATRYLELRRLYVPLRVQVEIPLSADVEDAALEALEKRRAVLRWGHEARKDRRIQQPRVPTGERLAAVRRLVVLGDPGAGKSTLVRWIATAYLLRLNSDPDWRALPDVATLPDEAWLPILIRCRDLTQECLHGALDDILCHTLRKAQMTESESECFRAFLPWKLLRGEAILLIDGLDEIQDPGSRARFCEQIEAMHVAFPDAPIIVTSRIVGYREMRHRIGRGFEHVTIADLAPEEKDTFIDRWCALTERPERREEAAGELKHDVHSADRIERLTGNPMLLTTMALVKRKVGKLPSRRAKLYWEAVNVLLNWRSAVDPPLDDREALPQLEYVAYVMCQRGVQQLREDGVLELLEAMRAEYPNVRPAHAHSPEEFLHLLERRTGLLVEAGTVQHLGRPVPVYEFRHLTFQEYLAGLALVDGKYPNRDRSRSLAQHLATLAGQTGVVENSNGQEERVVVENWREPLRLCVASCSDDDVEDVLLAILRPLPDEEYEITARPRAVLAALCLADEPNVSDATVGTILAAFAKQADERDGTGLSLTRTSLDVAALELAGSCWAPSLEAAIVDEFRTREGQKRESLGRISGLVTALAIGEDLPTAELWLQSCSVRLRNGGTQAISAALGLASFLRRRDAPRVDGLVEELVALLAEEAPVAHAAARALRELGDPRAVEPLLDRLDDADAGMRWAAAEALGPVQHTRAVEQLLARLQDRDSTVRRAVVGALGLLRDSRVVEPLLARLHDSDPQVQREAATALEWLEDSRAVEPLLARLDDPEPDMRRAVAGALGWLEDSRVVEPLLVRLGDPDLETRLDVIYALGEVDDPRVLQPLLATLDDPDSAMRRAAADALGSLGDTRAVGPLLARLDDPDADVRWEVVHGLGQLRDPRAVEPLLARLDDSDPELRLAVTQALWQIGDSRAVELLLTHLDDPEVGVRRTAAQALGHIGSARAVEPLLASLKDSDSRLREAASVALGRIRDSRAVEPLLALLDDPDPNVRSGAAEALGQIGDWRAVEPLLVRLNDPYSRVPRAVCGAVGQLKDPHAVESLLARLNDLDTEVQQVAAKALGQIGDIRAVEPLLARLNDPDFRVRQAVAEALGQIGDMRAVEPLLARLEDSGFPVRSAATRSLGKLRSFRAVKPLLIRLHDSVSQVRAAAVGALGGLKDLRAVEPLLDRLDDSVPTVRLWAAWALGELRDPRAMEPLLARLSDPVPDVRLWAAWALGELKDSRAVEPLLARLDDPASKVRVAVADALGALKDPRAAQPLFARLDDPDSEVRSAVADALGEMKDLCAADPLLVRLGDERSEVRSAVARALGGLKDPRAVEPLLARLDDPDSEVRATVADVLGGLKDPCAVEPLLSRLDDPDSEVRAAVADALGELKDPRAVEPLLSRLDDPDSEVRAAVADALGELKDPRAVEPLLIRLDDLDSDVRRSVVRALGELTDSGAAELLPARLGDSDADMRRTALRCLALYSQDEPNQRLLSRDLDALEPFVDPRDSVTEARVQWATAELGIPRDEVRLRYEAMAQQFKLRLGWEVAVPSPSIVDGRSLVDLGYL